MLYQDPVTNIDIEKQTLTTNSGKLLKYGSLIIATGCTASRYDKDFFFVFFYPKELLWIYAGMESMYSLFQNKTY